jgi:hypothetical protein
LAQGPVNDRATAIRPALNLPDRQPAAAVTLHLIGQDVQNSKLANGKARCHNRWNQAAQYEALAVLYPWPAWAPERSALRATGRNSVISLVATSIEAKLLCSRKWISHCDPL